MIFKIKLIKAIIICLNHPDLESTLSNIDKLINQTNLKVIKNLNLFNKNKKIQTAIIS
jgi:hypothetical protein